LYCALGCILSSAEATKKNIIITSFGQPTSLTAAPQQPCLASFNQVGAADIENAVKVTDDDTTWYVLPAGDEECVYLVFPAEIATKSLRRAACLPSHQDSDDDSFFDDRCALRLCLKFMDKVR
jgi:hypothetical protein